jgi:dephospho-CoA kinase
LLPSFNKIIVSLQLIVGGDIVIRKINNDLNLSQSNFDYIIGISSPQSMRLNRTIKRDNTNRELILEKMEHQLDEQVKMKLCDFVLQNDEKTLLTTQVIAVHEKLIALSKAQQPHD